MVRVAKYETGVKFLYFRSGSKSGSTQVLIKGASGQLSWVKLETVGELSWRLKEERKWRQRLEQNVPKHVLLI